MTTVVEKVGSTAMTSQDEPVLGELVESVRSVYEQVLGRPIHELNEDLRAMGGDSISLVHILSGLMDRYGVMQEPGDPAGGHSVAGMAAKLLSILRASEPVNSSRAHIGQAENRATHIPLMPNRLSYFVRRQRGLLQWTMATPVLELTEEACAPALHEAFRSLLRRHDSLRLCMEQAEGGGLLQRVLPEHAMRDVSVSTAVSSHVGDWRYQMEQVLRSVEQSMEYEGSLIRLVLFEAPCSRVRSFAIVMHHICVDYLGFCRAIEEFISEYDALRRGLPSPVSAPRSSYADFVDAFMRYQQGTVTQSQAYWLSLPWEKWQPLLPSIRASHPLNVERLSRECSATAAMHTTDGDNATASNSISLAARLLAAITIAYREWKGGGVLLIDMLFHGRESFSPNIDAGSVVGWMSDVRPILLDTSLGERALLQEAERQVSWVGCQGASYGYLRYVDTDVTRGSMKSKPVPEISLNLLASSLRMKNYLGVCVPLWPRAAMSPASPEAQRAYLLSGGCKVSGEQLQLSWDFSSALIDEAEVAGFTRTCVEYFMALNGRIAARQ